MLGEHVIAAGKLLAVGVMAGDRLPRRDVGERLGEGAMAHPGGLQHQIIHQLRERGLCRIDHQRLGDLVAAA
jgi:hypothetical protein